MDPTPFIVRSKDDGGIIVAPAFDVVLYTAEVLTSISPAVLNAYREYLALIPSNTLRWYLTENMSKHKPVTPRAMEMLETWLRPGGPKREIINIELRDGDDFTLPAQYTFFIHGREPAHLRHRASANVVRCVFPLQWALDRIEELLDFAKRLCNAFPFQSGHGGYVLQTSKYVREESETAAWKLGMRYLGFDIRNEVRDLLAVRDAVKGVNWLTMLADDLLNELGGVPRVRSALSVAQVGFIPVRGGVILRAGQRPIIGDIDSGDDLSAYRAVYELIEPLQAKARDRYGAFALPGPDHVEKTERWLTRFSDA